MKQIIFKNGSAHSSDVPAPIISPNTVLIKVVASCISAGTELIDAIYISAKVLEKAKVRFSRNEKITFKCGTIVDHVIQKERYDLITSITVLQHHVEDEELVAALTALRTALKPDGRIVVLELAPPHEEPIHQYINGVDYLVERPPESWYMAFKAAGLKVMREPVMPQFGIACLRGINRIIGMLLEKRGTSGSSPSEDSDIDVSSCITGASPAMSLGRRLRRKVLELMRSTTLFFCFPIDHWLMLPLPTAQYRTYRIFVLGKE